MDTSPQVSSTVVEFVGIAERRGAVRKRVTHPPRTHDLIRWMKFSKGDARCRLSYYEVVQVQWDVRDARHYEFYRPGDEGECYLTVFLRPVRGSPGELFDRRQRAEYHAKRRRVIRSAKQQVRDN